MKTQEGYRGDRFYLNKIDDERGYSNRSAKRNSDLSEYYFSQREYVQQVNEREVIQCIMISTYRLELEVLVHDFPMLFSLYRPIPSLILHGDKGRNFHELYGDYSTSRSNHMKYEDIALKEENEEYYISTPTKSFPSSTSFTRPRIPSHMTIAEVTPTIYKDVKTRKVNYAAGVHHPKYILIFTNRGLHVIITTANVTASKSIDATWTQFFPKRHTSQPLSESTDFGLGLMDFLTKQCEQIRREFPDDADADISGTKDDDVTIFRWLHRYTGIDNLDEGYEFSQAAVKLISTVPCRQPLPPLSKAEVEAIYARQHHTGDIRSFEKCMKCKHEEKKLQPNRHQIISYGSMRVKEILTDKKNRWPRDFQPNDLLFVQPTSIGQNLNLSYIEEYLSHLMPDHFYDDSPDEYIRSEQWRCVWPSHRYMKHVHQQLSSNDDGNDLDYHEETEDMKPVMSGPPEILFFHPKSFALMEPDIQAQFFTYQTNHHVIETHRIPHIKSYTRLYKGSATGKCLCHQIAWTMLTSACLSKGAQGELKPFSICKDCKHIRRGYWEYRNFELGVLFKSSPAKQYYAMSADCPIHPNTQSFSHFCFGSARGGANNLEEIVLPFPYDMMKSEPYCSEQLQLQTMPFFRPMHDVFKYLVNLAQEKLIKEVAADTAGSRNQFGRRIFKFDNGNQKTSAIHDVTPSLVKPSPRRLDGQREQPIVLWSQPIDLDEPNTRQVISLLSQSQTQVDVGVNVVSEEKPSHRDTAQGDDDDQGTDLGGRLFLAQEGGVASPINETGVLKNPIFDDVNEGKTEVVEEVVSRAPLSNWRKISPASNRKALVRQIKAELSEDSTDSDDTPNKRRRIEKMSQVFQPSTPPKQHIPSDPTPNIPDENQSFIPNLQPQFTPPLHFHLSQPLIVSEASPFHAVSLDKEIRTSRDQKKRKFEKKKPNILDMIDIL